VGGFVAGSLGVILRYVTTENSAEGGRDKREPYCSRKHVCQESGQRSVGRMAFWSAAELLPPRCSWGAGPKSRGAPMPTRPPAACPVAVASPDKTEPQLSRLRDVKRSDSSPVRRDPCFPRGLALGPPFFRFSEAVVHFLGPVDSTALLLFFAFVGDPTLGVLLQGPALTFGYARPS